MPMRSLYHRSKVATKPPVAKVATKVGKKGKAATKVAETVVVKKDKTKKESK